MIMTFSKIIDFWKKKNEINIPIKDYKLQLNAATIS